MVFTLYLSPYFCKNFDLVRRLYSQAYSDVVQAKILHTMHITVVYQQWFLFISEDAFMFLQYFMEYHKMKTLMMHGISH